MYTNHMANKALQDSQGFGAAAIVVLVLAMSGIGVLGWYVWHSNYTGPATQTNSVVTTEQNTPADNQSHPVADDTYKIDELRLELTLNDQTQDLATYVSGNTVWFTLDSFLSRANATGYSLVTNGYNSCERLAGIRVFISADEVRAQSTEITGELIDDDGNPIADRIMKLNDNRYAEPIAKQSSCANSSGVSNNALFNEENSATTAIRSIIKNSLRSY